MQQGKKNFVTKITRPSVNHSVTRARNYSTCR